MVLSRVRGVRDILEKEAKKIYYIIGTFRKHTSSYGYEEVILPSLEESSLFIKSLGDSSDIVTKEMFYIKDNSYVLRPEGTAGVIRAYLMNCSFGEKKMWSYCGSMFRHERPQSGRYREFYQFGVENIGNSVSALIDAEAISMAFHILKELKLENTLHLNTLGDDKARKSYNKELEEYFSNKVLSKLSKNRLAQGHILRILDSKEPEDQETINEAPSIKAHLSDESLVYYEEIKETLKFLNVPFIENQKLVRGLDYYTHACFEFIHNNKAIIGGGRYDNSSEISNKNKILKGIGWAAGLDRISEAVEVEENRKTIIIATIGKNNKLPAMKIAGELRRLTEFVVYFKPDAENLKQHLADVKEAKPSFLLFLGDDEIANQEITIKNCNTREQKVVKIEDLVNKPKFFLE